jgi:hypothetical protein
MAFIPFVFIWKGESMRSRSEFCQYLLQKEVEEEEKKKRRHDRQRRRSQKERTQLENGTAANGSTREKSMV